jgi:hypothetical protein
MPLTTVNPALLDTQAQYTGFKNRIINGAMVIDQRNAGASVGTGSNNDVYTLDRWQAVYGGNNKYTIQQSTTTAAGFTNSLLVTSSAATSTSAGDIYHIGQTIEGFNVADLGWGAAGAQTVTMSFLARSSLTGTFGGALQNSANNRSYPFTFTISAANTFEYKTITIAGDTSGTWVTNNGSGLKIRFNLGSGSTYSGTAGAWAASDFRNATGATSVLATNGATFYITGVQLEKGSTATSFDYRPFGAELVLCERYFEKSFNYETAPAHNTGGLPVVPVGSNLGCGGNAYWTIPLKTCKRINNYTVRWYDPLGAHPASENWVRYITACDTGTAAGPNSNMVINSLTTNHIAGHSQVGTAVPPIIYWTADAEL